jgi:hypothetical protein
MELCTQHSRHQIRQTGHGLSQHEEILAVQKKTERPSIQRVFRNTHTHTILHSSWRLWYTTKFSICYLFLYLKTLSQLQRLYNVECGMTEWLWPGFEKYGRQPTWGKLILRAGDQKFVTVVFVNKILLYKNSLIKIGFLFCFQKRDNSKLLKIHLSKFSML